MLHLGWLSVFVGAEQADVEVIARIFKIIRIATKECDLFLRGEDEPDIRVFFRTIQVVLSTTVKRDYLALQPSFIFRLFLDGSHDGAPGPERFLIGHPRLNSGRDSRCDILDAHQDGEFLTRAYFFFVTRAGVEPVAKIVMLLGAQTLEGPRTDVMIGQHQTVLGYKLSRSTTASNRR